MLFAGDVMLDWGILDVINEQGDRLSHKEHKGFP